jgi:hypothetical protein
MNLWGPWLIGVQNIAISFFGSFIAFYGGREKIE